MVRTTTERRRHERTPIELDATIERIGGRPLSASASTLDLSEGGACFVGPDGFGVGDVVRVRISRGELAVERQALVVGKTAQAAKRAALNLAFKMLDGHDPAVIERILAAG
ncbi:MAG TPA: PilZ domain-containing protein [Acidimicrobiales bacterium]|nr:PilZ domain-containing protein [Acidimicrobiales bacterium]